MQSLLNHLFLIASFVHLSYPIALESINEPKSDTKHNGKVLSRRLSRKSPWFSNEPPSTSGPMIGPIYRVDCRLGWCKEKQVRALDSYGITEVDGVWTQWFSSTYLGRETCPPDTLVTQIDCWGPRCDGMRLKCSRVLDSYYVSETMMETNAFSEELSGYGKCPDGYYLRGMKCSGDYCDNISLICAEVTYHNVHPILVPSRWFSGESFPFASGIASNPIYRVDCRGGWCREKRVHSLDFFGMVLEKRGTWTPWFYSQNQSQICPDGTLVTQIQCGGMRCGKMRLRCGEILSHDQDVILSVSNDYVIETEYFSEEGQGYGECPSGFLLVGIKCEGGSCDNQSLLCAPIDILLKMISPSHESYYDDDDF